MHFKTEHRAHLTPPCATATPTRPPLSSPTRLKYPRSFSTGSAQYSSSIYATKTRRTAHKGDMARKSNGRGSDPSTADASAHEDVEMQDQDDKMNGFKKFGVSETRTRNVLP